MLPHSYVVRVITHLYKFAMSLMAAFYFSMYEFYKKDTIKEQNKIMLTKSWSCAMFYSPITRWNKFSYPASKQQKSLDWVSSYEMLCQRPYPSFGLQTIDIVTHSFKMQLRRLHDWS